MKKKIIQDAFAESRERELAKDERAKQQLVRNEVIKNQRDILAVILVIGFCVLAILFVSSIIRHTENLYASGLSDCLNDGYSQTYCQVHNIR